MVQQPHVTQFAGPVDTATYGEYSIPGTPGPLLRFTGRITTGGEFTAEPARYHIYGGWFCPWSHRVAITRALAGLEDIVGMSFVDDDRDGRGWAFREQYGPDPVNGFMLLRQAYEATEEGFDGHVSVPALWDRATSRLVSNDTHGIGIDLASRFGHLATPVTDTYPEHLRGSIEELDGWLGPRSTTACGRPPRLPARPATRSSRRSSGSTTGCPAPGTCSATT
ncbi:hypothetical protein Asp14428_01900 [Actinoplanes sp. NBRC 14428]|nr:hypothetical protein Asp14428_01900 [Actinoplanes sp. NBRC 14428]